MCSRHSTLGLMADTLGNALANHRLPCAASKMNIREYTEKLHLSIHEQVIHGGYPGMSKYRRNDSHKCTNLL